MKQRHETKTEIFEIAGKVDLCVGYIETTTREELREEDFHGIHYFNDDEVDIKLDYIELQIAGVGIEINLSKLNNKQKQDIIDILP